MAWGKNGTPDTLTGSGDIMTITDLTANKFNTILCHALTSGTIETNIDFDNITTSTYAMRAQRNGGTDDTGVNQTSIATGGDPADSFHVYYIANISGEEKLLMGNKVDASAAGAGTAPERREQYGKATQTTQFTEIDFDNAGAGDFISSSNLSVLGSDLTLSGIKVQDGSIFYDTDLNKEYVLYNGAWTEL